jgi:hypothetical protein
MLISATQKNVLLSKANLLSDDEVEIRIEDFAASSLAVNPIVAAQLFPDPDASGHCAINVAVLTKSREILLRDFGRIPNYVVTKNKQDKYFVCGINTYLRKYKQDALLIERMSLRNEIRKKLINLKKGHCLEAIAAAILAEHLDYGAATRKGSDQGIDALGRLELMPIPFLFVDGSADIEITPGENTFVLASSKAVEKPSSSRLPIINPAHIRELIGGWLIQRGAVGQWQEIGLKQLSPLQCVLVTTYRLSLEAKSLCRDIGVQVWSIPELVYLICKVAPKSVFPKKNKKRIFDLDNFKKWWSVFHDTNARLKSGSLV